MKPHIQTTLVHIGPFVGSPVGLGEGRSLISPHVVILLSSLTEGCRFQMRLGRLWPGNLYLL